MTVTTRIPPTTNGPAPADRAGQGNHARRYELLLGRTPTLNRNADRTLPADLTEDEHNLTRQRQAEGIALAKAKGKYVQAPKRSQAVNDGIADGTGPAGTTVSTTPPRPWCAPFGGALIGRR